MINNQMITLGFLTLLSLCCQPAFSGDEKTANELETQWVLQIDNEAIQVWTATVTGSNFKKFKGHVKIQAPINAVIDLIQDTEQLSEWYYNTVSAKALKTLGPNQSLKYAITKTPWPVTDRDSVVLGTKTVAEDGTVTITLEGRPSEYPLQKNLIRIPKLSGHWIIKPTASNRSDIEFVVAAEPGGDIPSWLANSMVVDMPFYTLRNLRDKLEHH